MTREEAIKELSYIADEMPSMECADWREAISMAIKAVEQEPCGDAISRQALLDDFGFSEKTRKWGGDHSGYDIMMLYEIQDVIESQPSVKPQEPEWIPISERLPEVGSEVLVCFDFKGKRSVYISDFYGDGEFHGLDDEYLTPEGRKYRKAVAWMPLPEPYKASPTGAESEDV